MEDLHRAIAMIVAKLPARLRGKEIRFLRTYLGLSSSDAARVLGVQPATMSRWENEKSKGEMSAVYEHCLRLMVFNREPAQSYPIDELKEKRPAMPKKPSPIRLRRDRDWHSAVA